VQLCPSGQRSIADDVGRCPDQAQRASAVQAALEDKAAHASGVMQTPCGQRAPGGHSVATARHSHPIATAHAS